MQEVTANWLAQFDAGDKAGFLAEMRAAIDVCERTGDASGIEDALRAWKATARALSDPEVRAALTGPLEDADFTEVQRPESTADVKAD